MRKYTEPYKRIYNPITAMGFWQCLPFSWTLLRGKHCWHPIAIMGVVDICSGSTSLNLTLQLILYNLAYTAQMYLQLPLRQWDAGIVYLIVLSS